MLDQLASQPANFESLQELMDITLELDTRYHERQKEKGSHQEMKPPIIAFNSSKPPQGLFSKRPYHRKNKKGKNFQVSKDKHPPSLLDKYNRLIGSEKERSIKKVYALMVVERTQLKKTSRGLQTGNGHKVASLASRESREWGS
ncbi:hypothetical protein O181_033130 [Austropuccinia psidii MF-1]|uniref:Uncharacterized protein n=1 Tax=Austropuccinia psidii MF-1 TaxID=1389203 RepID=A0A9Q3D2F5_9BASI|nr:hypothetical protein [Austropuccinia psidii MF-1]